MSTLESLRADTAVERVLGDEFSEIPSMRLGATTSGHQVRFGTYSPEGATPEIVAVKPYMGKKARDNAHRERVMTGKVRNMGFVTLDPLFDRSYLDEEDPTLSAAVFVTRYEPDYQSGNTLSLEADPATEDGLVVQGSVTAAAMTLADLHNRFCTHGDPKLQNFMFHTSGNTNGNVMVIDLEKTNVHTPKRDPGTCASPERYEGAVKKDLWHLADSLGVRQYGGDTPRHFTGTVVEPYMDTLLPETKGTIEFLPVISYATDQFHVARVSERLERTDVIG